MLLISQLSFIQVLTTQFSGSRRQMKFSEALFIYVISMNFSKVLQTFLLLHVSLVCMFATRKYLCDSLRFASHYESSRLFSREL